MRLSLEEVDLAEVTAALRRRFTGAPPAGYLDGRTALRDAVVDELRCSELEAEELVDTLIARGFIRYEGDPAAPLEDGRPWSIGSAGSMGSV